MLLASFPPRRHTPRRLVAARTLLRDALPSLLPSGLPPALPAALSTALLLAAAVPATPRALRAQPPVGQRAGGPPTGAGRPGGPGRPAADGVASTAEAIPDDMLESAVRVFLDCQGLVRGCDRTFLVQEMGYVNWVRDRFDSDVHLLITSLAAGNGGRELTVNFIGQKRFAGKVDTLQVYTLPNDADDRVRRELLRTLQLGLAPYVARTPIASRLRIGLAGGPLPQQANPRAVKDPWNFWLFRVDANISASGEQLVRNTNLTGTVSAARTTEQWKINLGATSSYNERDFKLTVASPTRPGARDTISVVVLQRSAGANGLVGRTLDSHWTAGVKVSAGFSEILNQKFSARLAPAVEYNVWDWNEATRRQLTALYTLGANNYRYYETTVFDRDEETRLSQSLLFSLASRQKWGNTNLSLEGAHYLHDPERNHVTLSGFVDLRLGRGFSLNLRGSASRVRDQIYIAARGTTERDILTQRQQLQTNFRYNVNVGMGYTFGSIYNTVVNQRFGSLGETGRRFGFGGGG